MNFLRFSQWGIFQKIMSISIILNALVVLSTFLYVMPYFEQKLIEEKRNAARDVLDIAYEVIVAFEKKAARGDITGAQAQQEALSVISHLRYRDNDYFWVNDLEPKMLMHPIFPSLNGKNLSHDKDPTGKLLFMEMVTLVQQQDEGFVEYLWPRPGTTEPVPKLSYVKLFKPWAWIIGSGIYIDDVKAELTRIKWHVVTATLICVFIVLIVGYFYAHKISELWKWLSHGPTSD